MENFTACKDDRTGRWTLDGVEPDVVTYEKICGMLRENRSFKFARYGDGEWNCIFNKAGQNCDGHQYFPSLGTALRRVILAEPQYLLGMQPLSMSYERSDQIKQFCVGLNISWVNADVLHNASIDRTLDVFIRALHSRYIVLVGPAHLAHFFPSCVHIVIPEKDCWLQYENIRQQIEFHVDGANNAVVLMAASMMANVLVDDFSDYPHTFIDVGSVFDPYCNVFSRKYHYKLFNKVK